MCTIWANTKRRALSCVRWRGRLSHRAPGSEEVEEGREPKVALDSAAPTDEGASGTSALVCRS
eukprot:15467318-Alexandrium_andersonii.AAC.1